MFVYDTIQERTSYLLHANKPQTCNFLCPKKPKFEQFTKKVEVNNKFF